MRGQPLVFLGTVVLVWTAARTFQHMPDFGPVAAVVRTAPTGMVRAQARSRSKGPGGLVPPSASAASARPVARQHLGLQRTRFQGADDAHADIANGLDDWLVSAAGPARSAAPIDPGGVPIAGGPLPFDPEWIALRPAADESRPAPGTAPIVSGTRWSVYGWSLLRQGTRAGALAPGAQYGGSQAGLIVRYAMGDRARALSVYARAATALASDDDRTLAIGAAARPWAGVPVDLAVERRFGLADGQRDRFAAMLLAGGGGAIARSQVRLDAFGQAGIVGRSQPQGFFDLQMLATRQVAQADNHVITVGGGVWAGGQQEFDATGDKRWVHRVDLGPRVAVALPVREGRLTVALDWRQRVDGNALPASGATITVSTGF